MPVEVVAGLEEDAVELVDRLGQAGQAEVERPEADADEVVDVLIAATSGSSTSELAADPDATCVESTMPRTSATVASG